MAGYYKFKIEKDADGYRFFLLPNNSNTQPVGISAEAYDSYSECKDALEEFRSVMSLNPAESLLRVYKIDTAGHVDAKLVHGDNIIFNRKGSTTGGKTECKKWAERIKKNINAVLIV
jgi:uncharacterized protein YegP (UPF0339 family)